MKEKTLPIGRLAPSPTGHLHLGNAWSFLMAWLASRQQGGKIFLRMEDIDPQRSKQEFIDHCIEDLIWLGLDWDGDIIYQSQRFSLYEEYLTKFKYFTYPCTCTRKELREMAGAPQQSSQHTAMPDMGASYTGKCRSKLGQTFLKTYPSLEEAKPPKNLQQKEDSASQEISQLKEIPAFKKSSQQEESFHIPMPRFFANEVCEKTAMWGCGGNHFPHKNKKESKKENKSKNENEKNPLIQNAPSSPPTSIRLACPPFSLFEQEKLALNRPLLSSSFSFSDLVQGEQKMTLGDCGGDFALQRSDKVWAYQFAVSIDDSLMGINQVVRGMDILSSTPRQLYLFDLFEYPAPRYAHIPLLLDEDGERLAKRHASLSLRELKKQGITAGQIISYFAQLLGLQERFSTTQDFLSYLKKKDENFLFNALSSCAYGTDGLRINYRDLMLYV